MENGLEFAWFIENWMVKRSHPASLCTIYPSTTIIKITATTYIVPQVQKNPHSTTRWQNVQAHRTNKYIKWIKWMKPRKNELTSYSFFYMNLTYWSTITFWLCHWITIICKVKKRKEKKTWWKVRAKNRRGKSHISTKIRKLLCRIITQQMFGGRFLTLKNRYLLQEMEEICIH